MRLEVRALPPERLRHSATDVVEHQKGITNLPREGRHHTVPSSRGLGHHPLKVETRVRTPLGLPEKCRSARINSPAFVFPGLSSVLLSRVHRASNRYNVRGVAKSARA